MRPPCWPGLWLPLLLLCSCATREIPPPLPGAVPINADAGRGGLLIINLRLADGTPAPFMVDSGTSLTCFGKAWEAKLGQPTGTTTMNFWGAKQSVNIYAMPKLYLGGVPLVTGAQTVVSDFGEFKDAAGQPVAGILGYDTLRHYCVQMDFAGGALRFLDDHTADTTGWGQAWPLVDLNDRDDRPAVAENLLGRHGPHSLIDSGCNYDGWLMPENYQQWTNSAAPPAPGEARAPDGRMGGEIYPFVSVTRQKVESDGIGLRLLARNLVTLDFPRRTLYLRRQAFGPLTDEQLAITPLPALNDLCLDVLAGNTNALGPDLAALAQSPATDLEKNIAARLAATLDPAPGRLPAEVPATVTTLPLGNARPETATVGWLQPEANRIPLNGQINSPLLDSGKIYATGLFAHAPSRYVFNLGGQWQTLHGEAGLHTAFQPYGAGVVFVIKADGREVFHSGVIQGAAHVHYDVPVTGVNTLELTVEKATDNNTGNWALWLDPRLTR